MILLTGGAGYIGSHTLLRLLEEGYEVVVLDDLSNGHVEAIRAAERISKKTCTFIEGSVLSRRDLDKVFRLRNIEAVIHLAGKKAVGESVEKPLEYFETNLVGSLRLLQVMEDYQVDKLVFSSSATVYGDPVAVPIPETAPVSVENPYGRTKLMIEQMLADVRQANPALRCLILRYFNPIGAHESGHLGESPLGKPNNLLPFVAQVASGQRQELSIFGSDYPTKDGSGVRDYIHVMDLAEGHLKALQLIEAEDVFETINLGTGQGYSVLEVVSAFSEASGCRIPYRLVARRKGDVAVCYADASRAKERLSWESKRDLKTMCEDAWRWQENYPEGY